MTKIIDEVETVITRKIKLQKDIANLLNEFISDTSLSIKELKYDSHYHIDGKKEYTVHVKVDL